MPKTAKKTAADYTVPLNMNGLNGRMLSMPAPPSSDHEILFIYGQHSSLERWWGLEQALNELGPLTVPDLPGFGGMDKLYKIGEPATIDNLADYLAAFIKLRYKHKKVTIVGMSLGFVIATRMLQRCPDLVKKVDLMVSVAGFANREDFVWSRRRRLSYIVITKFFSWRLPSWFFQTVFLQPFYLRRVYHHSRLAKEKFKGKRGDEFKRTMDIEMVLWQINDLRTQMKTSNEMLRLNHSKTRINLPVWHVAIGADRYFDNLRVEQHMRQIFKDVHLTQTEARNHAPSIIADVEEARTYLPEELRQAFKNL